MPRLSRGHFLRLLRAAYACFVLFVSVAVIIPVAIKTEEVPHHAALLACAAVLAVFALPVFVAFVRDESQR